MKIILGGHELASYCFVKVIVKSTENISIIIIRHISYFTLKQYSDNKSLIANTFDENTLKMKTVSAI